MPRRISLLVLLTLACGPAKDAGIRDAARARARLRSRGLSAKRSLALEQGGL